jgi:peptide/nickel transport system substrate-binding protein
VAEQHTVGDISTSRPRRPTPFLTLAASLVMMALIAGSCGSSSKNSSAGTTDPAAADGGTPVDGGSLVIGIAAETKGWNPPLGQWADTGSLEGSTVIEPLATQGEDKGAKPWLADSWIANDSFTEWTINLHPGVKFSDGESFDSASVKKSIDYVVTGPLSGLALKPMIQAVDVVDPLTVKVTLLQPWASFPSSFLQGASSYQLAPAMIDSADHGVAHPIGTGPFVFDSWTPDSSFKVTKNPNYWQPGLPHLDSLEFRVIPDETARADALKSGDVNMIYTTSAGSANRLAGSYAVTKDWTSESAFVMTSTAPVVRGKPNPLSDIHARLALAYATDPVPVAATIGEGVQIPSSPWSPPSPWSMPKDQNGWVSPNLDQAKQEVASYLTDSGASSLDITLSGLPNIDDAKVLQQLASQWKQAGINVTIESLEQTAYITKIATGDYQAAFFRNYGFADPDANYVFFSSSTAKGAGTVSINFTQYTTPDLEKDLATGRTSGFPNVRKDAYDDLVKQLNASATNIWLYNTPYSFVADPSVHGLSNAEKVSFGNYMPKTWQSKLWRTQ